MATRKSVGDCIERCEESLSFAQDQFTEGTRQEHYHNVEYMNAMQQLEDSYNELCQLANSANSQQREELHRMRLRLQQLQNQMTLLDHDRPF